MNISGQKYTAYIFDITLTTTTMNEGEPVTAVKTVTTLQRYSELSKWASSNKADEGFPGKFESGREEKLKGWCERYQDSVGMWLFDEV